VRPISAAPYPNHVCNQPWTVAAICLLLDGGHSKRVLTAANLAPDKKASRSPFDLATHRGYDSDTRA